jgi:DNA-binding NtrC family response regulator
VSSEAPAQQKVLVIEDDPGIRANVVELLLEEGFDVSSSDNGLDGLALANARLPEVIVCDIMLPRADGYAVLKAVRESSKTAHIPVIFLTAKADRGDMRVGMNLGADDYVTKPFALAELLEAVRTRLRRSQDLGSRAKVFVREESERLNHPVTPAYSAGDGVVVLDPAMQSLYDDAGRAAVTNINVLILGETGVGKEVLARAIHNLSPRKAGPFLALNCTALPESLLESELFGHEKGAFTGALSGRSGLLEAANSGTVFLDEIGDLPLPVQTKLLRVLEERKVMRVGGRAATDIDVRFLAATNRDLERDVAQGVFREDLFYRLNGISFFVPPLRERRAEIEPLSRLFVARFCAEHGRAQSLGISAECLSALEHYDWPGNLRELRNAIERAVVMCPGEVLLPEHLPAKVRPGKPGDVSSEPPADRSALLRREMDELERERIQAALDKTSGNQTLAAKLLGISRRTLVYRLTALRLPRPRKSS